MAPDAGQRTDRRATWTLGALVALLVAGSVGPPEVGSLVGLDLAGVKGAEEALSTSTETGAPSTTHAVRLDEFGPLVLVVQPVYRGSRPPVSAAERNETLLGHLAAGW